AHSLEELATECDVAEYGGGNPEIFGEGSGGLTPIAVENFQMLQDRQMSDTLASPSDKRARVNLLNWDGKSAPAGIFPPRPDAGGDRSARDSVVEVRAKRATKPGEEGTDPDPSVEPQDPSVEPQDPPVEPQDPSVEPQ